MINDILIFGTGYYWEIRKKYIIPSNNIIGFLDNDIRKKGEKVFGKIVYMPNECRKFEYDYILIVSDKYESEMRSQLLSERVISSKILNWKQYVKKFLRENYIEYLMESINKFDTLIVSNYLDYTGAPMTAIYAAYALQNKGKKVVLCAENIDEKLERELRGKINIVLIPSIMFIINCKLKSIILQCNNVLVNTFVMYPVVCRIGTEKNILWWIHESKENFESRGNLSNSITKDLQQKVSIMAVSKIAKNNFNIYFPNMIKGVMSYGIPDKKRKSTAKRTDKVIFALIGSITVRKAQDIYIEAVKKLSSEDKIRAEFYIIGKPVKNNYAEKILEEIKGMDNVFITGEMTRTELHSFFDKIDIVVCPSREDPLPIVMTEAMMHMKPCIASDSTGTAEYIRDGINGFICKTGDIIDLRNKMQRFIRKPELIKPMGEEARKTYEEYFTMEVFSNRLDELMNDLAKEKKHLVLQNESMMRIE